MSSTYSRPEDDRQIIVVQPSTDWNIWGTVHLILAIFALYLSFLCNQGFNLISFLAAICCPYLYIPYILATKQTTCPYPIFGNAGQSGKGFF
jgi:hypothetical protein